MTPRVPPLRGKTIAALRAVAGAPAGLRVKAYPSVMPLLLEMGLVEERRAPHARHREERAWFLTGAGRETVRIYGADDG